MKVSVIVVSYNTAELLSRCLDSLAAQAGDLASRGLELETIVVDNASADGSPDMVRQRFGWARLVDSPENLGFAAANNLARQMARGRHIVLLNPDARLAPGSLGVALDYLEANPGVAVVGGAQTAPDGRALPSARRFPRAWHKFSAMTGLAGRFPGSRLLGAANYTWHDLDRPMPVDWVPGSFALIRGQALDQVGFFDDRYFLYYEETDLCLRLNRAGWEVHFHPGVKVVHDSGAASRTRSDRDYDDSGSQLLAMRMRSEALYLRKNHGLGELLAGLGLEIAGHALRLAKHARPGRTEAAKRVHARKMMSTALAALADTRLGRHSPPTPW
jgi:GT2 family glycosyltransferase